MHDLEGYVLAGGLSRRMGQNKAVLTLGTLPLVEHSVEVLQGVCSSVSIVGELPPIEFSAPVLKDIDAAGGVRGAIVGLLTALSSGESEFAAILACDMPFVTAELFQRMIDLLERQPAADAVLPEQPDGRLQPLCGIYRRVETLEKVRALIDRGEWKLSILIDRLRPAILTFKDISRMASSENVFRNLNTPEDYEAAKRIFDRQNAVE